MPALTRTLIASLIATLLVAIVVWTMPLYPWEPCGILLPEQGAKPPVVGPMRLFDQMSAPTDAQPLGAVTMMYHSSSQGREAQEVFFQAINQLVTQQGGDGVVLEQFFFIPAEAASGPGLYFKGKVLRLAPSA